MPRGRPKGAKNKKTVVKERIAVEKNITINEVTKEDVAAVPVIVEEERIKLQMFRIALEPEVKKQFDIKAGIDIVPQSYILYGLATKFLNGEIPLVMDSDKCNNYMWSFMQFSGSDNNDSELATANRLLAKHDTGFALKKYPFIFEIHTHFSMIGKGGSSNTSYLYNELLKIYLAGKVKIDVGGIGEWKLGSGKYLNKMW
jgi:hypothetical protein